MPTNEFLVNQFESVLPVLEMSFNHNLQQSTINARQLHKILRIDQSFRSWIREKIRKNSYKYNIDYIIVNNREPRNTKMIRKDYFLTLESAINIVEIEKPNNASLLLQYLKGYLKNNTTFLKTKIDPRTLASMLISYSNQIKDKHSKTISSDVKVNSSKDEDIKSLENENKFLKQQVQTFKNKANWFDNYFSTSVKTVNVTDLSYKLNCPELGRTKLLRYLRSKKILNDITDGRNCLVENCLREGWGKNVITCKNYNNIDYMVSYHAHAVLFQKGVDEIVKMLQADGYSVKNITL